MFGQGVILLLFESCVIRPLNGGLVEAGLLQEVFHHGAVVEDAVQVSAPTFGGPEITIGGEGAAGGERIAGTGMSVWDAVGVDVIQRAGGCRVAICLSHMNLVALAERAMRSGEMEFAADGRFLPGERGMYG